MTWKFKPDRTRDPARITRSHWFETDAHWSLCGKVPHGDDWIDDVSGMRLDCRACEKRIMKMEKM